jgi:hypothetical protein
MSVPKTFQNQVGTIQLSDLDDNFANLDSRCVDLENKTDYLESKIVNLNQWTVEELNGVLYFKFNNITKMSLNSDGDLKLQGNITAQTDDL